MQSRYLQLHIEAALSRSYDYVEACHELHLLLRQVYLKAPKPVQLIMYNDVLTAFRLLAGLDNSEQLVAANLLVQAVEIVLPRQRRSVAVSVYKQAAVAFHRRVKRHESDEPIGNEMQMAVKFICAHSYRDHQFPFTADLLVHIFGFLDARSLVMASAVSRAWHEASMDDGLWRPQFLSLFRSLGPGNELSMNFKGCWRKAFEIARQGRPSRLMSTNRASCLLCKSALWISEGPWVSKDKKTCSHRRTKAMTVFEVVTFVRGRSCSISSSSSSSSSDTDSDEDVRLHRRRLWAF